MQTKLTFSRVDFLASPSAPLEKEKGQRMNASCGTKCYEQFKKLNPNMSLQKMSLVSRILMADWYSSRCALTWKLKGTKFNRLLFVLQPKTHRTAEIGAGLLQTPSTMEISEDPVKFKLRAKIKSYKNGTTYNSLSSQLIYDKKWNHFVTGQTSQLNPRFVAEMMGFPVDWTELPFQSGEQNQSKDTATQ
jgi:hypothetical protein